MKMHLFRSVAALSMVLALAITSLAQTVAFDPARMDRTASPCGDFYQYVNGTWLKETELPASESRWGTFNILADRNNEILREVLEEASATKHRVGSDQQLIGDYYSSCMNLEAIERAGASPLDPTFRQINSMRSTSDVVRVLGALHNSGIPSIFSFGAGTDLKDSNAVVISAFQGGISLPNRNYYTDTDAKSIETRAKFVEHMTNMFKLLGDNEATAAANARTVLLIQTSLANASLAPVDLRNPDNRYNMVTVNEAQELTPAVSWQAYMRARGVPVQVKKMNVAPADFFREANELLTSTPVNDWKTYMRWMTINSAAPSLSKAFVDENFSFYGQYLSGQKEQQPRWKTCVQATNGNLGEALGMEYARRTFKPVAKERMNEMIDNLMVAMRERINNLDWMSPDTKEQAQYKLSTFKRKIGYPDVLRGYKGLAITRASYATNNLRSNQFQIKRNFQDLGKPRDKTRWGWSPSTVNASYSSANNEINFPAGILQPPFFNFDADDAINYGAIGGVIGHEITHGFDDQGSRFDADGNLKMWWTADDRQKFEERASCVVKQWDSYEVQPGLFMVGKLALGENIGDFAGLSVAYDAFKKSMEGKPRPPDIDGFSPEQRFFMGWGQIWASIYSPEAERRQVQTGPHSLPRWRVNGPLSNMPQFREAFSCKAGDTMVREDSCSIW
ncbi:MAG: M13 family metallopeptidase [Blastocatellia bacterium]|nr:M13 family metallopeptidase [Blastocatellia bacterium]